MIELSILYFLIRDLAVFVGDQMIRKVAEREKIYDHFIEIEEELQHMKRFLEQAAEGMHDRTRLMEEWVEDVKAAAYQVEDLVDEFLHLVHRRTGGGIQGRWNNMVHHSEDDKHAAHLAAHAQKVKGRLVNIWKTRNQLGLNGQFVGTAGTTDGSANETLPSFDEGEKLIGIETSKIQVIQWLISDEQQREAVWVLGMGGLGKTTLVRTVYNHPRVVGRFDLRAWVHVGESYNLGDLWRSMAHELQGVVVKEELEGNNLSRLLEQKRYLIVLDDVWKFKAFTDVLGCLPSNNHGSRILVTARNANVITSLSGNRYVLNISPLSDTDARFLFHKAAFGSATCPPELDHWATIILSKCRGLPLAIVAMGRVMAGKPKDNLAWKNMCRRLEWELSNNENLEGMVRTLMLSYKSLPYSLQRCFLYCSLFKEGQLIKTKWLIRKWIAEGFIIQDVCSSNMTVEDIGMQYVEQLVARNMLQVVKKDAAGQPKVCRLHEIMRDLALKASQGENLCVTRADQLANLDRRCRRLSIMKNLGDRFQHSNHLSQVRTLLVFTSDHPFSTSSLHGVCKVLKFLRVLDLRGAPIDSLPSDVFDLFNLRYLSLRGTNVIEIPSDLENLYNLQTLDLWKTKVTQLPRSILKLRHLRHLYKKDILVEKLHYLNLGGGIRGRDAPSRISDLSNLQTLKTIQASQKALVEIAGLMHLRQLGVTNLDANLGNTLCNSMKRMERLSHLSIKATDRQRLELDGLSPPPDLRKLILNGPMQRVPDWFRSLNSLTHLYLFNSWLPEKETPIPSLGGLANLVLLALDDDAYQGMLLHFVTGAFRMLQTLVLSNLRGMSQLIVEDGALPNLQVMYLRRLRNLRTVRGIQYMTQMQVLYLKSVPIDASRLQLNPSVKLLT